MPSLAETYAAMHAVLRGGRSVSAGATDLGVDPSRLRIYRDFVHGHVIHILAKQFPRVVMTMDTTAWAATCQSFFTDHPPTHWELNEAAKPFPRYLAERVGVVEGVTPFHVSLAQFEWAQWAAFSDPVRIPTRASLTEAAINPTLTILEVPCPIVDTVVALDRGEPLAGAPLTEEVGPERVLVFRHPVRETSAYWRASDRLVLALATVDGGLEPEDAAARFDCTAADVTASLARATEIGLVIHPA